MIVRGTKNLNRFLPLPGIMPESVQNMLCIRLRYRRKFTDNPERMDEIAAVMIEPIQSRRADFHPKNLFMRLEKLTKENNVLMILMR